MGWEYPADDSKSDKVHARFANGDIIHIPSLAVKGLKAAEAAKDHKNSKKALWEGLKGDHKVTINRKIDRQPLLILYRHGDEESTKTKQLCQVALKVFGDVDAPDRRPHAKSCLNSQSMRKVGYAALKLSYRGCVAMSCSCTYHFRVVAVVHIIDVSWLKFRSMQIVLKIVFQETLVKAVSAFKLIAEKYVKDEIDEKELYVHRDLMIKTALGGKEKRKAARCT